MKNRVSVDTGCFSSHEDDAQSEEKLFLIYAQEIVENRWGVEASNEEEAKRKFHNGEAQWLKQFVTDDEVVITHIEEMRVYPPHEQCQVLLRPGDSDKPKGGSINCGSHLKVRKPGGEQDANS